MILAAAVRVVGREGLPAASLGVIAKEAGTSKPAVLYHFGSRENLLREMAARALEQFQLNVFDRARADDPADTTRNALDILFAKENRANMAAARELMSLGLRDPVVGERVRSVFDQIEGMVALTLPETHERPLEVAEAMVGSVHGFIQLWLCTGDQDPGPYKAGALRACLQLAGFERAPS